MNFAFWCRPPRKKPCCISVTVFPWALPFYKTLFPFHEGFQMNTTQGWVLQSRLTQSICFQFASYCCIAHCFVWEHLFNIGLFFTLISSLKSCNKHFICYLLQIKQRYHDTRINIHRVHCLTVWPKSEQEGTCVTVFSFIQSSFYSVSTAYWKNLELKEFWYYLYCFHLNKPWHWLLCTGNSFTDTQNPVCSRVPLFSSFIPFLLKMLLWKLHWIFIFCLHQTSAQKPGSGRDIDQWCNETASGERGRPWGGMYSQGTGSQLLFQGRQVDLTIL